MFSHIFTWTATTIALAGTVLNCRQNRACFVLWLLTNAMWLAWDIHSLLYSRAIMDLVQFALAGYGLYEWRKIALRSAKSNSGDDGL